MEQDPTELVFKITGGYTVATIPMERLALYLATLSKMLGEPEHVHLVDLVSASVGLVIKRDPAASEAISERIEEIQRGDADVVYMENYRALDRLLREDTSTGGLSAKGDMGVLLEFPGISAPPPIELAGVPQVGSLDGVVIRLGGKGDNVPVTLQSGERLLSCVTKKAIAKRLGKHIFESEVRVHGSGRWSRNDAGVWSLHRFVIADFEVLERASVEETLADLRAVEGANWDVVPDLWADAAFIRSGKPH